MTTLAWQLGGIEARRMLRHPGYPVASLYIVTFVITAVVADPIPPLVNFGYAIFFLLMLLIFAPLTFVAASRVAAGTYRKRVRDVLSGTPVTDRQRTIAAIAGLARGPVVVGFAGAVVLLLIGQFTVADTTDPGGAVYQRTALEYLQVPVVVLGAGLLGIAVARWLPRPGVLPVAAIVLWLGTIAMCQYTASGVVATRSWFMLWPVWGTGATGMVPRQPLGQEMWHLAYLLGLSVLAGVAALLRSEGPKRFLYAVAGAAAVVTALGAWLQLG